MTTNKTIFLGMTCATILAVFLWAVVTYSREWGRPVGSLAIGALWAWIMYKFVKMLDVEQQRKIDQERAEYERRQQ